MKISTIVTTLSLTFCSSLVFADNVLPYGAIKKGSWVNKKLAKDTMIGVASKVATLGCSKPESFKPYVMKNPQGKIGERVWWELWVVAGCNNKYPIKIRFNEKGSSSANWTIK